MLERGENQIQVYGSFRRNAVPFERRKRLDGARRGKPAQFRHGPAAVSADENPNMPLGGRAVDAAFREGRVTRTMHESEDLPHTPT